MKLEFSHKIFEKYLHTKFNENPSTESQVAPCVRRTDGQSDKTKLTVAFHNFANAAKSGW